jgi:hypothetical protein
MLDTKVRVIAFYKGTPMDVLCNFDTIEEWNNFRKMLESCITSGLKNGVSLKEQEKDYLEQLDIIEINCNRGHTPTEEEQMTYCMNIACLIKMKKLKDDNMNGFVVICLP